MKNVAVLGAGSWGIALARLAHKNGCNVTLWEFNAAAAEKLEKTREEKDKLPGVIISPEIKITSDISLALKNANLIILAVPAQLLRSALKNPIFANRIDDACFLIVSKGLEVATLSRLSEVVLKEVPWADKNNVAVLSGPSHAEEVAQDMPATVVVACFNTVISEKIQLLLSNKSFRIYTNTDVSGVELAGSLKNVIAIAAGISDGLGFGDNAKGALLTRGITEISRLGVAMGAKPETFFGLAGIGDLITTCISRHSRNRYVGEEIGKGRKLSDVLGGMAMVAEGVETARSAYALGNKLNIEMPITGQVYDVLFNNANPHEAVKKLMLRDYKNERD